MDGLLFFFWVIPLLLGLVLCGFGLFSAVFLRFVKGVWSGAEEESWSIPPEEPS